MKIQSLISLAMAAFLMAACSNEEELASPATKGMLKVTVEGNHSDTRAGFDATGKFYWSNVDHLGVTTASNATTFSALNLTGGGGTGSATFEGIVVGEIGDYAVYPYEGESCAHSIEGNNLKYNFPTTYNYTKVDTDFFAGTQGEGNSFRPAMFGKIENGSVTLKHLGGVICIKIPKMSLTEGKLTLTADKQITGEFTVPISADSNNPMQCTATQSESSVTINFSNASTDNPGVFYVPVPTGTYSLNIKVSDSNGTDQKINVEAGTYSIKRCDLRKIELNNVSVDATASATLNDAATTLSTSDNVSVSGEINSSSPATITIPSVASTSKSLSLENVATGASLAVVDANESGPAENSVDNFTLSIPNSEITEVAELLDVTISMPNTTVTLAGNGGAARYGTVKSKTADQTLIISSGVTVNKVDVVKGNVRVNKGAELTGITRNSENTNKVIIYKESGAIVPNSLDPNVFEIVDVAEVDIMEKVLADGGSYTLSKDIEGDFVVSAKNPVTINLNGHKITNKTGDTFTVNEGSFLTIAGTGTVDNISHAKACIYNNGTVVLNGGTYTRSKENGQNNTDAGGNSYYNILNHGIMTINQGVSVSQSGKFSSMIASGYYDYPNTNPRSGYVAGTNAAAPKLTINGGNFSGGLNTIKNDDGATLEIKDGTFENMSQATVQNHHVTTIIGGTFNCSGAIYAVDNEGHSDATQDLGDMTISGGVFSGRMLNNGNGADMTVTGGTFSDPVVLQYLGANANVGIVMTKNEDSKGFKTEDGQTVEIDMGRYTLTLTDPTVGSTNTETNSCQLLKGSTVTFKNGRLTSQNTKIVIQNYCNLTLDGVTLDTPEASYSVSNNNGVCNLKNSTINAKSGGCAFDVYSFSTYEGVTVNVTNCTINGNVEFGGNNNKQNGKLTVGGGTMNGNLMVTEAYVKSDKSNITIGSDVNYGEYTGWADYKK